MSHATETRPLAGIPTSDLLLRLVMFGGIQTGAVNNVGVPLLEKIAANPEAKLLQTATRAILKATAYNVFFGGTDVDEASVVAYNRMRQGIAPIIDYSAPEINTASEANFDAVVREYVEVARNLGKLKEIAEEEKLPFPSMAIKVSTLAPFEDLVELSTKLREQAPLTPEDDAKLKTLQDRLNLILMLPTEHNLRAYVDAEQVAINPVILHVTAEALRRCEKPTFTLQAYLKDAEKTAHELIALGKETGNPVDIKLVRGAYIDSPGEREHIWDTKEETDAAYNKIMLMLARSPHIGHITVASHNAYSATMADAIAINMPKLADKLSLAKLRGIGDAQFAGHTLPVEEYLPYTQAGHELDGVAYFARRGTEMMGQRAAEEIQHIVQELSQRPKDLGFAVAEAIGRLGQIIHVGNSKGQCCP